MSLWFDSERSEGVQHTSIFVISLWIAKPLLSRLLAGIYAALLKEWKCDAMVLNMFQ